MAKSRKTPIHALIDADIVVYQSCAFVERPIQWEGDWWTLHSDGREAKELIDVTVAEIVEATSATKVTLCFSSSNNWRMGVLPDYKANRASTRKPLCYRDAVDYCVSKYTTLALPRLEADDVIGITATRPKVKDSYIIVSEDKDFQSIPGTLYNPKTNVFMKVTKEAADRFHLYQTLVGDSTDNYKGCPGIGPVKAEKILDGGCNWDSVLKTYLGAGLTEQDALTQARVARILRHGEYDRAKARVHLWKPEGVAECATTIQQ